MIKESTFYNYGVRTIYLVNTVEKIAFKIVPDDPFWYAKPMRGSEFRLHYTSVLASETLMTGSEITQKEYQEYG